MESILAWLGVLDISCSRMTYSEKIPWKPDMVALAVWSYRSSVSPSTLSASWAASPIEAPRWAWANVDQRLTLSSNDMQSNADLTMNYADTTIYIYFRGTYFQNPNRTPECKCLVKLYSKSLKTTTQPHIDIYSYSNVLFLSRTLVLRVQRRRVSSMERASNNQFLVSL